MTSDSDSATTTAQPATHGRGASEPGSFDIYCRRDGRWRPAASFPPGTRDAAIAEAKRLDGEKGVEGVRVMSTIPGSSHRKPIEVMVWFSPRLEAQIRGGVKPAPLKKKPATPTPTSPSPPDKVPEAITPLPPDQQPPPPAAKPGAGSGRRRFHGLLLKILLVIVLAFAATSAITWGASSLLPLASDFGLVLEDDERRRLLTGGFIFSFLVAAAMLATWIVGREDLSLVPDKDDSTAENDYGQTEDDPGTTSRFVPSQAAFAPAHSDPATDTKPADATPADARPPSDLDTDPKERRFLIQFLQSTILSIKDRHPHLDAHTAFGIDLFLAGACDRLGAARGMDKDIRMLLIRQVLTAAGTPEPAIERFLGNLMDYGSQTRLRFMIRCGGQVMDRYLKEDAEAFKGLLQALESWTSSRAGEAHAQGVVSIMFTDLVGSTRMTREKGDFGAQEVLRIHNGIVRNALAFNGGREIKHTGDGILAVFATAAGAVEAACMIQSNLARHNANPEHTRVDVRIGINAGDVVREENDIFGAAVQLAARTCDKSEAGRILVTRSIVDLTPGHDIQYRDAGLFSLKGIEGEVPLYEVALGRINAG